MADTGVEVRAASYVTPPGAYEVGTWISCPPSALDTAAVASAEGLTCDDARFGQRWDPCLSDDRGVTLNDPAYCGYNLAGRAAGDPNMLYLCKAYCARIEGGRIVKVPQRHRGRRSGRASLDARIPLRALDLLPLRLPEERLGERPSPAAGARRTGTTSARRPMRTPSPSPR